MTTTLTTVFTGRSAAFRASKFGAVGVLGLAVNLLVQAVATEVLGWNYITAAVIATQVSSTFNFVAADVWVFRSGSAAIGRLRRYGSFLLMNNAALLIRAPMMWVMVDKSGVHYTLANLISLMLLTVVRFAIADRLIWKTATLLGPVEMDLVDLDRPDAVDHLFGWPLTRAASGSHSDPREISQNDRERALAPTAPEGRGQNRLLPDWLRGPGQQGSTSFHVDHSRQPAPVLRHVFSPRAQRSLMVAIVASGAFLRLYKLMALGFNSDEAVYASQAAGIAGDRSISAFFPIFRAHPMLFQAILSVPYQFGTSDLVGRLASVAFGLATIVLMFCTARLLYGDRVGLVAAMLVALMPYHVIVTRQVLLDGPMTFFATLSLYFLARFVISRRLAWLLAASCSVGLTTLAKETYIILVGSLFMFFALSPEIRLRLREAAMAVAVFFIVLLPFPITVVLAGKSKTGKNYLSWQLFRRSNHDLSFYPSLLPSKIGYLVLVGAVIALGVTWGKRRTWRERMLLSWILVPSVFLEVWPVKGFHYLLAASMPIAILGARGIVEVCDRLGSNLRNRSLEPHAIRGLARIVPVMIVLGVAASIAAPSWSDVQPATSESFLAGTGGVPGGREVGEWIRANVPEGAEFMTVGPSMANLVQYYGRRKAYGLSVSLNPLNRNPSYVPIVNPDRAIRTNNLQYVVWDSYSTKRSEFFGDKLIALVERYNGRAVFSYSLAGKPVIVVYEVRP